MQALSLMFSFLAAVILLIAISMFEVILRWSHLILLAVLLIVCVSLYSGNPRDATDGPDTRSGMRLHTDAETGCDYLSRPNGALIPRRDRLGKHMCKEG
jgi:hypothetical protein